jgi:hypothetical protein
MVRQLRSVGLAARFGADVARAGGAALRGRRRAGAREAAATLRGFTAGALRADGWRAPVRLLERLPAELRPHVEGRRVHGWPVGHGAQPHFLYGVGEDRVLHVYADAPSFLDEAVALRAELGDRAALLGAPALVAAARTATALWVLEARVHGRTVAELPLERWWQPAVGRVLAMGDVRGPRLSATGWWREARRELPGVAGPGADAVAAALDRLAGRPATLMHGDLQPKNLLWQDGGVAVIDWNGAMAHGVPGCDLLFLALTARGERPDARAVARLARGEEPLASAALAGLGLAGDGVAAALLVSLALWTREERSRLESLGTAPQPPVFAPLLAAMVPELAPQLAAAAAA